MRRVVGNWKHFNNDNDDGVGKRLSFRHGVSLGMFVVTVKGPVKIYVECPDLPACHTVARTDLHVSEQRLIISKNVEFHGLEFGQVLVI